MDKEKLGGYFCPDEFFDFAETLNTTAPELSQCFQYTALVWTPCAFFWIFTPLLLYALHKSQNLPLKWNITIILKIVLSCLLTVDAVICFIYSLYQASYQDINLAPVWHVYPLVLALTTAGTVIVLFGCRNRGVITSGVLFLFWLLLTICGIPELQWKIKHIAMNEDSATSERDPVRFTLFIIWYFLVVAQLILSCFADQSSFSEDSKIMTKCPELKSSFLNQITFHWFTGLAIKGHRKPLEKTDLWQLNDADASASIVPQFERRWRPQLRKHRLAKQKREGSVVQELASVEFSKEEKVGIMDGQPKRKKEAAPTTGPSLLWALFNTFRRPLCSAFIFKFAHDLLQFVSPHLLKLLIGFIGNKNQPLWHGIAIAVIMFSVALVQSMILHQYFHTLFRTGMNIRSVLTASVFSKSLTLSNGERKNRTVGEIVNLMSVDIQRFQDMTTFMMLFWSAPLQVGLSIFFLWRILGPSVLAGLAILIAMVPLNSWLSIRMRKLQVEQMKYKDDRLKAINETLNGIKVLKLYAWEPSMEKMILDIRQKEIFVLRKLAFLNAFTTLSWACAPFMVAVLTFGVFVTVDPERNVLTPQVTFVSLALFNILRFPLGIFAMIISQAVQCSVSNKRLKSFLSADEIDPRMVDHLPNTKSRDAVVIENGQFSWDGKAGHTLKNINVAFPRAKLIAVVGKVGSGKSSLLASILGEMDKLMGSVSVSGTIAYSPQQAWIQNLSLKDNIIFGQKWDEEWYNTVVDACALRPDFDTLPAGDETEIGEKGINLSGGQKQRVSLARAVYQRKDIVLLDDPLSAVDSHVGKHIFDNVICDNGLLGSRTRILVTHGLHYLKHCDEIIVLRDGSVSETGTYQQLLANAGAFAEFLEEFLIEEISTTEGQQTEEFSLEMNEALSALAKHDRDYSKRIQRQISQMSQRSAAESPPLPSPPTDKSNAAKSLLNNSSEGSVRRRKTNDEKSDDEIDRKTALKETKDGGRAGPQSDDVNAKLIEKETTVTGKVQWSVYLAYVKAIGYRIGVVFVGIYVLSGGLEVLSNLWLADWSDDSKNLLTNRSMNIDTHVRLSVFASLGLGQALFVCLSSIVMALGMVQASRSLHEGLLHNILCSPMSFFDVTPLGRILNRFGKDVDVLDLRLPNACRMFIALAVTGVMTLLIPCIVTPHILAVLIPVSFLYFYMLRFYVSTSRQLKRLEAVSRSPIYSHFQETVQGAPSIRAYNATGRFIKESERRVDDNLITYYPSVCSNRWLAVRLEAVGNAIVLFAALFGVFFRESVSAGRAGLSVSVALSITQTLNWAVRMTSELETNIVAVERIKEYTEIETEAKWESENGKKPPEKWPEEGAIDFKDYQVRYRRGLDLVLKGVTFHIGPREKVGIVGRTGAGKSSLTLALFRLIEPESGRILIDDRDISGMGLHDLRRCLTIVPQDPVLFSGTLRLNLDPFHNFSSDQLWTALENAHLSQFVRGLPDQLDYVVSEGGQNLSVGQRQLICLGRALLRKTKVLVLDEAAAAVDMETDALIQKTIREKFADCTVLTIAHRLNTVLDSDRLLILDSGQIAEFDTPKNLLANEQSLFYAMAKDAGLVH